MSAALPVIAAEDFHTWAAELHHEAPDPEPAERRRVEANGRRAFRVGRPSPWQPRRLSAYKRRKLEPFIEALADLLVADLLRHPEVER
jgi:hypothetical protein